MRVIAFTDIHGAYATVEGILAAEKNFDVVVIGGDLTTHGTVQEAESALRGIQRFGKPLLVVAGNMDLPEFESTFTSLGVNINARGICMEDVGFFGIAGSPFTPMHTPYEISEDEIDHRAYAGWNDVKDTRWKVFVPHAPPRATKLDRIFLGSHVGSLAVREFVECNQPHVLICGHIHESRGTDQLGKTKMVNCGTAAKGSYAVIELKDDIQITLHNARGT
jgi:hypothetical protein